MYGQVYYFWIFLDFLITKTGDCSLYNKNYNMFTRHSFFERYFDMKSSLEREGDILHREIVGHGYIANFKRWWANLFLLSYKDSRGKKFFVSSHAIRRERARQYNLFKNIIHPFSSFRRIWEWLMLIVCLINYVLFHYKSSLLITDLLPHESTYFICAFTEIFVIVDLYINTKTGYIDEYSRKVIMERQVIVIQYFTRKVFLHAMGAIPLNLLMLIRLRNKIGCVLCKSNSFVCTLRFLSVFRFFRIFDASLMLFTKRKNYTVQVACRVLRICILGYITMMMIAMVSDTICLSRIIHNKHIDIKSEYVQGLSMKFKNTRNPSQCQFVVSELARLSKGLLLYGFMYGKHKTTEDGIVALVTFVIANFFYCWGMLECYAFLYRDTFSTFQWATGKNRTLNMLRCRHLPDHLGKKVEMFYAFSGSKSYLVERGNGLYIALLDSLKKEIVLNSRSKIISNINYFADWPAEVMDELTLLMKEDIYFHGDVISTPWAAGDCMVILESGVLGVYSFHEVETCHLIDGDYFGEVSLVTDKEVAMSSVVAISSCKVLSLDKALFRRLMRSHPKLFFALKRRIKKTYDRQSLANVSSDQNEK